MSGLEVVAQEEGYSFADTDAMRTVADEAAACVKRVHAAADILDGCRKRLPSCWEGAAFKSFYERFCVAVNTVEQVLVEDYGSYPGRIRVAAKRRDEAHGQAMLVVGELEVPTWAEV